MTPLAVPTRLPARVLLLVPAAYLLYINQGVALRRAFGRRGVDCLFMAANLDEAAMSALLDGYRPDVILSINGYKQPIMERFPEIVHVRWIQDNQYDQADYRKPNAHPLSDLCYTATARLRNTVVCEAKRRVSTLRFGADPVMDGPSEAEASTFSLVGAIWAASLRDTVFKIDGVPRFSGQDYFAYLEGLRGHSLDTALEQLDQLVEIFLVQHGTRSRHVPEHVLRFFREEYIRTFNRYRLGRQVLGLGFGCRFFGGPEWATWPEFRTSYAGPIATTRENEAVFRTTRVNLHNGGTVSHPRVFECLAARGGPLLANRTPREADFDLEPGIHYVPYDLSDFDDVARELVENHERRRAIREAGFVWIQEGHTWQHRVDQLLRDLAA